MRLGMLHDDDTPTIGGSLRPGTSRGDDKGHIHHQVHGVRKVETDVDKVLYGYERTAQRDDEVRCQGDLDEGSRGGVWWHGLGGAVRLRGEAALQCPMDLIADEELLLVKGDARLYGHVGVVHYEHLYGNHLTGDEGLSIERGGDADLPTAEDVH